MFHVKHFPSRQWLFQQEMLLSYKSVIGTLGDQRSSSIWVSAAMFHVEQCSRLLRRLLCTHFDVRYVGKQTASIGHSRFNNMFHVEHWHLLQMIVRLRPALSRVPCP